MVIEVATDEHAHLRLAAAGGIGVRVAQKAAGKLPVLEWLPDRPLVEAVRCQADMIFVVSGMEDEAVAQRTAELAALAREIPTCRFCIAVVTEGSVARTPAVEDGMQKLRQVVDALLLVSHQDLKPLYPDAPQIMTPLALEEYLVGSVVEDITRLLTERGVICIDFEDVRSIMCDGSSAACLGVGIAGAEEGSAQAAEKALARIREQGMEPGEKGAFLVLIKGSTNLTMDDFDEVSKLVHGSIHPDANMIAALQLDDAMGANFRVTIVAKKDALPVPPVIDQRVRRFIEEE